MRHKWPITALLMLAASCSWADNTASNAKELRENLLAGRIPTRLRSAVSEQGCGPASCSTEVDGLRFLREHRTIERIGGGRLRLREHGPQGRTALPEMNAEPTEGFALFSAGKRWGTCLDFGHEGVGQSGSFQRWTSVLLVPWQRSRPGPVAHRFIGYRTGCASVVEGEKPGEVVLPTVQPVRIGSGRLRLVWHRCSPYRCTDVEDGGVVIEEVDADKGLLKIERR